MTQCYIWLDFGCINQDSDPAAELKQLDKIVQSCDCILTPIVDHSHEKWTLTFTGAGLMSDYKASAWRDGKYAYLNRGWCRMEMFYAANVPLLSDVNRIQNFDAGLYRQARAGRRPHFLYGTKEMMGNLNPRIVESLQHSYLEVFNPLIGNVTKEEDRPKIEILMTALDQYVVKVQEEYVGAVNSMGNPDGKGKKIYSNGDIYDGERVDGVMHGEGKYTFLSGDEYSGKWINNLRHGKGVFKTSNGDEYDGSWRFNLRHGHGVLKEGSSDSSLLIYDGKEGSSLLVYDGNWKNGYDDKNLVLDCFPCLIDTLGYTIGDSYYIEDRKFEYTALERYCISYSGCIFCTAPACVCDIAWITTLPCACLAVVVSCGLACMIGAQYLMIPLQVHAGFCGLGQIIVAEGMFFTESSCCCCCMSYFGNKVHKTQLSSPILAVTAAKNYTKKRGIT